MPPEPLAFLALHSLAAGGCIGFSVVAEAVRHTLLEISDRIG